MEHQQAPVVVVGAGIAGVACARALQGAGVRVEVRDRGRVVGGRMASRRLEDRPVDLGASYLTVDGDRFAAVVEDWRERGLARPWTDTFAVAEGARLTGTKSGPVRWGAAGGLRSLVEDLAAPLDVRRSTVEQVTADDGTMRVDGDPAAAVVLAMPDPQARRLLGPGLEQHAALLDLEFEPVLALAATWPTRTWDDAFDGAFVNDDEVLSWVADDGRRRGDGAAALVAHSTPALAAAHLADPQAAGPTMRAALCRLLGLDEPRTTHLHRWSFAKPAPTREAPYLLTDGGLGVCGDGWGGTPKVEGAWCSGTALGEALSQRLA